MNEKEASAIQLGMVKRRKKKKKKGGSGGGGGAGSGIAAQRQGRDGSWWKSLRLMSCGCTGCHVVDVNAPWILGSEGGMALSEDAPAELLAAAAVSDADSAAAMDADDAGMYDHYLVQLDIVHEHGESEDATLCAFNISAVERVCYISATAAMDDAQVAFFDRHGVRLSAGVSTAPEEETVEEEGAAMDREARELQDRLNEAAQTLYAIDADEEALDAAALAAAGVAVDDMELSGGDDDDAAAARSSAGAPGHLVPCTTFICIIPAHTAIRIARVRGEPQLSKMTFPFARHPDPEGAQQPITPRFAHFPLGALAPGAGRGPSCLPCGQGSAVPGASARGGSVPATPAAPATAAPYLCTQGFGGRLTHFFPESYHAFDLRCPEGTPILAIAPGVVREVLQANALTGVHCDNLRKWNSIALDVDVDGAPFIVEYLHIMPGSVKLRVGDRVAAGDVLCLSGNVGFAPEPHVHIEVHRGDDPSGSSVRFELEAMAGSFVDARADGSTSSATVNASVATYTPLAGQWYGPTGQAAAPRGSSEFDGM